ncbi:MAG: YfhO family protein, partial [Lachnospiraceae bacterium]|nr:YfhO family protein [Lachnospiraceae bacterium]
MSEKETKKSWIKENRILIIGSVLIALLNIIIMVVYKCAPFGDNIFARGDNLAQILPYIEEFKSKIANGESLAYSWHVMGGSNFYYLICYTLTSPTMIPLLIVPMKYFAATLGLCVVAIAVLMFLSMSYYLTHRISKARLDKNQPELLMFAMAYGLLPAFVAISGYYPYLGVFVLVPFLILGLEKFVANLGWRMYFISLSLLMFFNFYIGGIVCIFVIMYYLTLKFKNVKEFFVKSLKIILMSVMALAVASVILIPVAYVAFNGGYGFSEYLGFGFFQNWFAVLEQSLLFNDIVISGSDYTNYWESNLYFGILLEILALSYFFNKNIRLSVRFRKLIVFVLLLFTLNESTCNYIMHLFHYTV